MECASSAGILEYAKPKDLEGYPNIIKAVQARAKVVGNKDYGVSYDQRVVKIVAPYIMVFAGDRDNNSPRYASVLSRLKQVVNTCSSRLLTFMNSSEASRAQGKIHISIDPAREAKASFGAECVGAALASQPSFKGSPSSDILASVQVRALRQTNKYFDYPDDATEMIRLHMGSITMATMYRNLSEKFYLENLGKYRDTVLKCNQELEPLGDDNSLTDFLKVEGRKHTMP